MVPDIIIPESDIIIPESGIIIPESDIIIPERDIMIPESDIMIPESDINIHEMIPENDIISLLLSIHFDSQPNFNSNMCVVCQLKQL